MIKELVRKASEIKVVFCPKIKPADRVKIKSSQDAYELFSQAWDMDMINFREEFKIMVLESSGKVKGIFLVGVGGISSALVDPRVIFAVALSTAAAGIILCHNHPSGSLEPGPTDKNLTKVIQEGAKTLGIRIEDHLIITESGYYSFADGGILA
jgi:DNA repair protein RadC